MDKNLMRYIDGEINAVKCEVVISREKLSTGVELVHVNIDDRELYQFWYKNEKKSKNPKHTGGKPSYAKIYLKKLRELRQSGVTPDLIGYMVSLSDHIHWGTGLLLKERSKQPMKMADISTVFMLKDRQAREVIKKLKELNLLSYDKEGYKVSPDFMQKGGQK